MARNAQSLADVASDVLARVEHAALEKTAATAYTSVETEIGRQMLKVAQELRNHKPAAITNEDLKEFRKRYGV
jgi:hypothetical protein